MAKSVNLTKNLSLRFLVVTPGLLDNRSLYGPYICKSNKPAHIVRALVQRNATSRITYWAWSPYSPYIPWPSGLSLTFSTAGTFFDLLRLSPLLVFFHAFSLFLVRPMVQSFAIRNTSQQVGFKNIQCTISERKSLCSLKLSASMLCVEPKVFRVRWFVNFY